MSEHRPFPPSPRRLALAHRAGLTAASPLVVGALACAAAIAATVLVARAAAATLGSWIATACSGASATIAPGAIAPGAIGPGSIAPGSIASMVLELAAPIVITALLAALLAHIAQTRSLWLPRRRVVGAPHVSPRRELFGGPVVIGIVTLAWLWATAPRLARLVEQPPAALLAGVGASIASLVAALAIAWLALGVIDALVRHAALARALRMTVEEKREDDRLVAADPRWRARRLSAWRDSAVSDAVAAAAVVLVGDDVAIAIAWEPTRQPVPTRSAVGRRTRATQLIGLARRHRVTIHRDVELARALVSAEGPVPETHWARLAEIVAATRRR